jgi:HEAT repeat protein
MRPKLFIALVLIAGAIALFSLYREKEKSLSDSLIKPKEIISDRNMSLSKSKLPRKEPDGQLERSRKGVANERAIVSTDDLVIRLQEISLQENPKYLTEILAHLTNGNSEVRAAALEATMQFGSRDAIPVLTELAAKTDDPREKVEILDAIEFIELPPLSEVRKHRKK